jgi:heptosyltransferase-2
MHVRARSEARRRVAVVQSAYLGDLVLTTPLLRELRRLGPDDDISVIVAPRSAGLAPCLPDVDRVVTWDKRAGTYGLRELWRMGRTLRSGRYAVGLAAQRSIRSGLAMVLGAVAIRDLALIHI